MSVTQDRRFMALALALGRRGLGNTWPNPAVGAVVVKDGVIVGRGWTQPGGRPHAETQALGRAGAAARGATLYVTLEPCSHYGKTPPCADAIVAAGIARVVSAIEDVNPEVAGRGYARLRAAGIAVEIGEGAAQARRDHDGHTRRMCEHRPHVTLKLAVSANGKVGLAGRKPVAITGEAVRARVHLMRAQHDAILVGIGTVLADDPRLTCRLPGMEARSPVRIVLDPSLRLPVGSALAQSACDTPVWVMCGADASRAAEDALRVLDVGVLRMSTPGRIDLAAALNLLAARGITRLMVEGGPTVAASFVSADLVDTAVLSRATLLIPDGIDALEGLSLTALTASPRLRLFSQEAAGEDHIATYERTKNMFTGIVTDIGEVLDITPRQQGLLHRIRIATRYDPKSIDEGASISCAGICLTVVEKGESGGRNFFAVDAAAETLSMTGVGRWDVGTRINLERSLRVGDELGGHIVSGHVDGVATLVAREDLPDMARLTFRAPHELARFIAPKGSVAIDGVSLTVNKVTGDDFAVLIIPHTLAITTIGGLKTGEGIHLEVDQMARYAARLMEAR